MTGQDYLDEWGEKNDTGQAPNFTPNLPDPDDIKPAPSGEDQIRRTCPKIGAAFDRTVRKLVVYPNIDVMHSASSTPTLTGERGNLGDAWREVNRNIYNASDHIRRCDPVR